MLSFIVADQGNGEELVKNMVAENCGDQTEWFTHCAQQQPDYAFTLLAKLDDKCIGYASILWQASYPFFAERNIPEIHGLFVLPSASGQRVSDAMVRELENKAAKRHYKQIGLGVGVTPDYQAALSVYINRGYKPDGKGLYHYDAPDHYAGYGDSITIDSSTTLWFFKNLA